MQLKYISNSREHQDIFVLCALDGKRNGTYLEVGAAHPRQDNNTFLLETEFDWRGVSVEWDTKFANEFNATRINKCLCEDARLIDYDQILQKISNNNHIDFLQLDVDPPQITFEILSKINFDKYSFSVITFEHDSWRGSAVERDASRQILQSHGYTLVLSDVMHDGYEFEDWYVNEKYMVSDNWKKFSGNKIRMNKSGMSRDMMLTLTRLSDNF